LRQQGGSVASQGGRHSSVSDQSATGTPGTDEDEESDQEQISSALYFPHRQVRPEVTSLGAVSRPSLLRARSAIVQTDEAPEVDDELLEQTNQNTNEVEISLQSQDENQVWHGDLQGSTATEESPPDFSSSHDLNVASSVSEYDSHDDSTESTAYDSSTTDGTGVTAVTSKHARHNRREHRPRAPVGAVELKPFNHQVGGHSTVYRFSRRAIAKQLNNRENVFYETVERYHPELLDFMPR
jgi:hypothetical protein